MFRKLLFFLLLACIGGSLGAQSLWSDQNEASISLVGDRRIVPMKYRTVQLDVSAAESLLGSAPERFKTVSAENQVLITLPDPDGGWQTFQLFESPVMAPELQAQYPEIRCYTGIGVDDPTATLKCDLTPWGFHAMVISRNHSTVFIDPYSQGDTQNYVVYYKKDYARKSANFTCGVDDGEMSTMSENILPNVDPEYQGDCQLRQYRLALACTGEYATFHGGTKPLVLAAMNTSMNRVNGVYETDLAITMQIIANNDLIIYLNSATDPYTNNDGATMLGQNQTTITNVIGSANYDIGHVFSTGGGGIASLSSVCSNNNKARGVTGGPSPIGDAFDIDYVAHEMGHQFGANHTQNNNCNRVAGASMEPGSASTIMGYAGICSPDVQAHSDDYFHAISLQEIGNFVTGASHTCPVEVSTGNHAPTVNGGPDYVIPKSTPFSLTAVGSDVDNDPLTYCWEQMDPEFATMPPVSTSATGPLFRSYKGTASPTRWFPRLPDLVANVNSDWEELPGVARTMKFRVTVRDNHAGAGCTEEDDVVITVAGQAGPLLVTAPNTNELWYVGETRTVTWNVASTNAAPVNCANVKLLLSTDGGLSYPITLLASTPNDGSADVTVPNNVSNTCRVMVLAVGNVFFDISNVNFRIQQPPVPSFTLTAAPGALDGCPGAPATVSLNLASLAGFNNPVNIAVTGAPAGATVNVTPNPVTPSATATVSISGLTPGMAGNYTLTITATSGAITQTATVAFQALPGAPTDFAELSSPADGTVGVPATTTLEWEAVPFAANYQVQVSTNPGFGAGSLVFDGNTTDPSAALTGLQGNTVYYWRIKAMNSCGDGGYSAFASFLTANLNCGATFASTNVPVTIDAASVNTATSTLTIPASGIISDANVSVQINHTWTGDLSATLTSPSGAVIQLFNQPGVPASNFGCDGDNINVTFDDQAASTAADFENNCGNNPAFSGSYQPINPLSVLNGANYTGTWTLKVTDNYAEDGGSITGWSMNFCVGADNADATIQTNNPLSVLAGAAADVETAYLEANYSGTAAQAVYTVLVLPEFGQLLLDGSPLAVGSTFTQADIDAGLLSYQHGGGSETADIFQFDFVDQNNGAWYHGGLFDLVIVQNSLVVSAQQTQGISCNGDASGEITVETAGGTPPLSYSINGGSEQNDNVFSGLPAGAYTILVTDENGFSATTNEVVIGEPTAISASASTTDYDVTVSASGGSGAYTYSIDGQNFQSSNVFEGLSNGFYTVTVQDENGCTATTDAVVAVNTLLTALNVDDQVACAGSATGSISVMVGGGESPYEYSLDGQNFQPENTFAGLPAGTYTVTVRDNQGFTATTNTVTLNDPDQLLAFPIPALNVINVEVEGGVAPYQYSLDGQNFQTGNSFGGLTNGVYTVTVMDANGCTATNTATIEIPDLVIPEVIVAVPIFCNGGFASLIVSAYGGVPPYEYSLDGGAYQSSSTIDNVSAGAHTITVRDDQGATTSYDINLDEPTPIVVNITVSGNDVTGVDVSGGTPPYDFETDAPSYENLPNGTYHITVYDFNGCTTVTSFVINVAPLQIIQVTAQIPSCNGSSDGSLTVFVSGGEPPYEYSLNNGPWQSDNTFTDLPAGPLDIKVRDAAGTTLEQVVVMNQPTPVSVSLVVSGNDVFPSFSGGTPPYAYTIPGQTDPIDLPNGDYTIEVSDANGCTASQSFTIDYTPISATFNLIGDPCLANSFEITATGGEPPYQYAANNSSYQSSPQFINLAPGSYSFHVKDAAGDVFTIPVMITVELPLSVTATSSNGTVTASASGGTNNYQYTLNGTTQASPVFENVPEGTYTVTVTDVNTGCTATTEVTVIIIGSVEPGSAWGLVVSPNPGQGLFRLTLHNAPAGALRADVFDAAGRLVLTQQLPTAGGEFQTTIDLQDVPQGLYLLRLSDDQNWGAVRLSVVR
ncbi:MAG: zinc-dependent metalloprotease family protein [Saprospiraceae bacterium]